jgi:cytidylate kinase
MALRGRPDVLHVRVVAPLEMRIARLQQEKNIPAQSARARLEASAKARDSYMKRCYGVQLDDSTLYHLVVNTGLLGLSQAVNLVIHVLQAWNEALLINKGER